MVRNFFEPLKDEIKDIIAPPKRALLVIDEKDPAAKAANGEKKPADGLLPSSPVDGPLRALPVEPLHIDEDVPKAPPTPRVPRALPVDDDVRDENIETP